ncbi:MAG: M23 family metallopeptidase [Bacteroidia bacterium]|nr:M23 family metallopeptidase [Bacteroidia bacterium]MDW8158573.1 M23 family metallopeptidase [Bacteroidia bacterium]
MELWRDLKNKFSERYDFIVINNQTLERKGTYQFTIGTIFFVGGAVILLVILLTTLIIFFTPIREWIPGYTDKSLRDERKALLQLVTKMENKMARQDSFIKSMQKMTGFPATATSLPDNSVSDNSPAPSSAFSRNFVAMPLRLFRPVEGRVTRKYNLAEGHWAIDIVAREDAPIFAVAKGTIFFADYTIQTGYTIGILHENHMISFYKHCKQLLKKPGSVVQVGEMIAIVGNSGEQSTGPHLHFELWKEGAPLDPLQYFEYPS